VNGTPRQEASTRDMVFGVSDILVFLTRVLTLEPGDLILTGTPAGIGHSHVPPQYLNNGDEVAITVAGIGTLINPIRSGA
jgi:2,4-diketo-3-deoxy-L-fuconate hydrolase